MTDAKMKNVYSEVYATLQALGDSFIRPIPVDIMDNITNSRNMDFSPPIDVNKPLNEQGLSNDAMAILAYIKKDFWIDDPVERQEFIEYLKNNEMEANAKILSEPSLIKRLRLMKDNG